MQKENIKKGKIKVKNAFLDIFFAFHLKVLLKGGEFLEKKQKFTTKIG